jgi:hypothetical protein
MDKYSNNTSSSSSSSSSNSSSGKLYREIEIVKDMLMMVLKKKEAEEFLHAVDPIQYPSYYELIKNPMNLLAIHNRLHPYTNIDKPLADIRLVWENCKKFNDSSSEIWKSADKLSIQFEELVRTYLGVEYTKANGQQPIVDPNNLTVLFDKIRTVLNLILKKSESKDFLYPVDRKQYPLYYEVIRNPMDLKTVQNRLYPYKVVNEVLSDIRLVWDNCRKFNQPGSEIYVDASHMSNFFEDLVVGRLGRAFQTKPSQSIQAEVLPLVSTKIPNSSYWNSAPTLSLININKLAGKPLSTFQARIPQGSKLAKHHVKPLPANSAVALSQMSEYDIHNKKRPRSPDVLAGLIPLAKNRNDYDDVPTYDKNEIMTSHDPLIIPQQERRGKGRPRKNASERDNKVNHRLFDHTNGQLKGKDMSLDSSKSQTSSYRKELEEKKNPSVVSVISINREQYKYCHHLTEAL